MKLKQATEDDLRIVASWIDSERNCRFWAGPHVSYPIRMSVLIREIGFRESHSYIGLVAKEIAGFGQIIDKSRGVNHLARIIVNPKQRGKGYGFELLDSLVSIASKNADTITLNVYRANKTAVNIYKRLGFVEDKNRSTNENVFMVKT